MCACPLRDLLRISSRAGQPTSATQLLVAGPGAIFRPCDTLRLVTAVPAKPRKGRKPRPRGRPAAKAPPGRVTIRQAAKLAGVSYQVVQRRIAAGIVPVERDESGVVTIARGDVRLIQAREEADPARADSEAVTVRAVPERMAHWRRAAGDTPMSVWLGELADEKTGYRG